MTSGTLTPHGRWQGNFRCTFNLYCTLAIDPDVCTSASFVRSRVFVVFVPKRGQEGGESLIF